MTTKLTRRELLAQSTVMLLMVPAASAAAAACSSGGSGSSNTNGCDGVFETSTVTNNHTHTLCVPTSDLTNPPSAGVTYNTSTDANHSHTVQLSQAQLQSINGGGSVTVTTSAPAAHNFTIVKA